MNSTDKIQKSRPAYPLAFHAGYHFTNQPAFVATSPLPVKCAAADKSATATQKVIDLLLSSPDVSL